MDGRGTPKEQKDFQILISKVAPSTPDVSGFDGAYYIDDYTAYEFDGKGNGAMCLGGTTRYVFDYSVKDDKVSFDFEDMHINLYFYKNIIYYNTARNTMFFI